MAVEHWKLETGNTLGVQNTRSIEYDEFLLLAARIVKYCGIIKNDISDKFLKETPTHCNNEH